MVRLNGFWRLCFHLLMWLALLPSALLVALLFGDQLHWTLALLPHFTVQIFLVLAVLAGAAFFFRAWKPMAGFLVLMLVAGWPLLPFFLTGTPEPPARDLSVGTMNVFVSNRDHAAALAAIREKQPDVMLVLETNRRWRTELEQLRDIYPYIVDRPQEDAFGITLLSKLKPEKVAFLNLGEFSQRSVEAVFTIGGKKVHFIGSHPIPPSSREGTWRRDQQLRALANHISVLGEDAHVILAGDFNTTPFSSVFQEVLAKARLRDSALGFGYQPTWPHGLPVFWIPIDHVLVSPDLWVAERTVGPAVGSDHYPVWVTLGFAPAE